eukprot:c17188_g1_i1 orf=107-922(-)
MCRADSSSVTSTTEVLLDHLWHYSSVVSPKCADQRRCQAFAQPWQEASSGRSLDQNFLEFRTRTRSSCCTISASQGFEKQRYMSTTDKRESSGFPSMTSSNQHYNTATCNSGTELPDLNTNLLHKVFNIFDQNKDGKVSTTEVHNLFTNLGLEMPHDQITSLLNQRFKENNGYVQFHEFLSLVDSSNVDPTDDQDVNVTDEEDLLSAFHLFDRNGDGFISPSELQTVLNMMGIEVGEEDGCDCVQMMIDRVDMDGDGLVSFCEFKEMMSST